MTKYRAAIRQMWTMGNTEGFTQDELDELNAALEKLMADSEADPANINDLLNNAWVPNCTADELYAAAAPKLGIPA